MSAALLAAGAGAQDASIALALKATFLARFGSYVGWPADAFDTLNAAINICVVGDDPFGAVLDEAVAGERVDGRRLRIVRRPTLGPEDPCHIAYLAGSSTQSTADALTAVADAPILTVTDADLDGEHHGAIHFVVVDDRVRFHIDEEAAADKNLALNSRLLGVALSVRRRNGE